MSSSNNGSPKHETYDSVDADVELDEEASVSADADVELDEEASVSADADVVRDEEEDHVVDTNENMDMKLVDGADGLDGEPGDNSAILTWDAPVTNADATCLADLAGYKVYYRTSPGACKVGQVIVLELSDVSCSDTGKDSGTGCGNIKTCTYTVHSLEPGNTYYFAVSAFDNSGNESDCSNEASKAVQ